jgi:hypothetical protein
MPLKLRDRFREPVAQLGTIACRHAADSEHVLPPAQRDLS